MQQLIGVKRSNLCFMLLSAIASLIVMAALAFACYLTARCAGLLEQSPASVPALAPVPTLDQRVADEEALVLQQGFFQTEGYEVLKRSLDLLEYMEQLEPVLEEHRSRQRREAARPDTPNRIDRRQNSDEIMYGVRRRTQREQDLGTLPIIYDTVAGVESFPRRKRHLPSVNLAELERAKRNAQQDYQRLEREYYRCRKSAPNAKICDQIHDKLVRLSEEVNARFQEMANLLQGMQEPVEKSTTATEHHHHYAYPIYGSTTDRSSTPYRSTSDRWMSSTPRVTTRSAMELVSSSGHIVQYDPRQHVPNVNSSIRSLDDLYEHINLADSTDPPPQTTDGLDAATSTATTPTTPPSSTEALVRLTAPTKAVPSAHRWIVTKSPKQAARNLHDVVNQLQFAQILQPQPIHEDMVMMPPGPPASVDELVMARARNRDHTHHDRLEELNGAVAAELLPDTTIPTSPDSLTVDGGAVTGPDTLRSSHATLQHQHQHQLQQQHQSPLSVGPSAPFLSLCDQLRSAGGSVAGKQQGSNQQLLSPHTGFQHGGPGFPITGEATKATSQIIVNSGFGAPGYIPNTVCFYQNGPPAPPAATVPYPFQRPATGGTSYAPSYSAGYQQVYQQHQHQHQHQQHPGGAGGKLPLNDPSIEAFIQPRLSEATIHMPVSIHNLQHAGGGGRTPDGTANNVLVCSMVQQHQLQQDAVAAAPERHHHPQHHGNATADGDADPAPPSEESAELALMFATGHSSAARAKGRQHCRRGWVPCFSSHQCVKRSAWCNSRTDCLDGSDESSCSCVSRLPRHKLCDGYADCPLGMDEMGCFGCAKFAFSCYHTADEFRTHRSGDTPGCYSVSERCDGFDHCLNRKDEQDCSMLVQGLGHYLAYAVPHTSGVLHRNYKGKWYPVCSNARPWAREACEAELGPLDQEPLLSHGHGSLPGPYISQRTPTTEPDFSESCNGVYVKVKCPPVRCGTSKVQEQHAARISVRARRNVTAPGTDPELVESVRIVGGDDAEPGAYPFIVGIFRDGKYHCGASIYNEHWIISAAHCCDNFQHHYYEVRSGMLRKRSYSPQVQVTHVTHMIVHHAYSSKLMANDIALLRVEHPFRYNRWVRPICLPAKHRTTGDRDWLWGPKPGTVCTAIGWGALREGGGAPDHLKHVTVPVLAVCKHRADRDSLQICAAEEHGGQDACQGDSGGPFVCQSQSNPHELYLAGVVSHGEGCARANEPGVYTRVALFIEWIEQKVNGPLPLRQTLTDCPGSRCIWGGGVCLPAGKKCNGFVNCLGGEDESECGMDRLLRSMTRKDNEEEEQDEPEEEVKEQQNEETVADMDVQELETSSEGLPLSVTISQQQHKQEFQITTEESHGEGQESVVVTQTIQMDATESPTGVTVLESTSTTTTTTTSSSTPGVTTDSIQSTSGAVPSTTAFVTESPKSTTPAPTFTTVAFEIMASTGPPTTEVLWKAIEKTIKEVQGLARARGNESQAAAEPEPDHPFFEELEVMEQEKRKRLAQFRLTVHNVHTKTAVTSTVSPLLSNETAQTQQQYRQFSCTNITQRINIAHRCDRIVDCEDGSDELNCTCRDYLKDKFDFLICDGKTDCLDHTDERNCLKCQANEYACRMSQICIPKVHQCNGVADCPLHEDELDCLALTDGQRVYFDANNLTLFRNTGLVTKNTNGTWEILCGTKLTEKTQHAVEKICAFLGFAGYRNYSVVTLTGTDGLHGLALDQHEQLLMGSDTTHYLNLTLVEGCEGLRVTCAQHINASEHEIAHFEHLHSEQPVQVNIRPLNPIHKPHHMPQIVFQENAHVELIESFGDDYDWPWNVDIYLDGVLICSGLIIDASWIVVASSCTRLVNMRHQYVAVVAGGAKSYLHIAGPYEQVVRVDCYHFIPEAETVMLHLSQKFNFSRHVLPTFIPDNDNLTDSECLAVGKDKYGRTKTLRVHLNETNCAGERIRCYNKDLKQPYFHHEYCYTQEATRSGVIVCKTKRSGWYPVGFYQNKRGLCGFNEVVRVTSLVESYHRIQHVLQNEKCVGELYYGEPRCDGMRCRYGKCIGESLICDRKLDCGEGSDEQPELCASRNSTGRCLPHELRCYNGKCVDKSKFCDRYNDCGDATDEPHDCSCYTYLKITDPARICDGVRNCWDKSDENPRVCRCHASNFRCGESDICVPYDFVCDKERDCPDGEDEQYCYALQQNSYEAGYGELMEQSYGIWHSKCFPKTAQFGDEYMRDICEQLGYSQVRKIYGRAIVEGARLRTANDTESPVDKLRRTATKAVVHNKFSKVVINDHHTFYMKPSRPMFRVINWNYHDEQNCHRLELLCAA
uniref:limulus clotting factor C n=2 Tax=Anopheles albimanus TaxID=7167 RepID=A0A182FG68_ANOAL